MGLIRVLILSLGIALAANAALIHQYVFSGNVNDQIGTDDGTLSGAASASGGVLTLNGFPDFVQFNAHIVPTSGSYTVALKERIRTPESGLTELISQGSSGGPGFYIGTDGSGVSFRITDSWLSSGVAFPSADGEWHRIVLVYNGSYSLYLDSSLAGSSGPAVNAGVGGGDTRFGRQFPPYDEFFRGDLADVRIYDEALSARQVANLDTTAIPEPASSALVGGVLTLLALGISRFRRK